MLRASVSVKRLSSSTASAKPFNWIPGPKSFPIVGSTWKYFPLIGNYDVRRLDRVGEMKLKEYGVIVKEEAPAGKFIVNIFDPEDFERVYKAEGKYPSRDSHSFIAHYREARPHLYNNGGVIPTNGPEWWRLRSVFQKPLARLKNIRRFLPATDDILNDFLRSYITPGETVEDFQRLVARLSLEVTWFIIFGERLDRFKDVNESNTAASQLLEGAGGLNESMLKLDSTRYIWRKWKTDTYRKAEKCCEMVESIVMQKLNERRAKFNEKSEPKGVVDEYFLSSEVDFKDITGIVFDLILGSVDTTSYQLCFAAWHLSKNPRSQDNLMGESKRLLPSESSPVDANLLNEAVYTRAVLKEVYRLNPIAVGISRILAEDVVLSGYLVPKGTIVVTQNMTACRQEKHFSEPNSFKPERWLKESSLGESRSSSYLSLPFSHGSRTCIARRFAEQNLLAFLLKVGRRYRLEWMSEDLRIETPLTCRPDRPVKIQFSC